MNEATEKAKNDFLRAKDLIVKGLSNTPDDRINWSPSPTARTPIHLVAHAATSVKAMHEMWAGKVFPIKTTAEAEAYFRAGEKPFSTREEALGLLEKNSADYLAWLEQLTPEGLEVMAELPFGMGHLPVGVCIGFMTEHITWHAAQLDYVQTIYGDLDWHM